MKKVLMLTAICISGYAFAWSFTWAADTGGVDRCYPASAPNTPVVGAAAVDDDYCGVIYNWGTNSQGNDACFPARSDTGAQLVGRPAVNLLDCYPIFVWSKDSSGNDKCYPAKSDGQILKGAQPVDNDFCG